MALAIGGTKNILPRPSKPELRFPNAGHPSDPAEQLRQEAGVSYYRTNRISPNRSGA
jgi:hypothetical protein